jgi:hypothetical protein
MTNGNTIVLSWKNQLPNVFWGSEPSSKGADNRRKISCKVHGEPFDAGSSPQGEIAPSQKLSWLQLLHQIYLYWDNRMGTCARRTAVDQNSGWHMKI